MKDRIKQIRKHFGLTQNKFATKIGRTTGFISNVETGRNGLSTDTLKAICSVYGVDEAWLKDGVGTMFAAGEEKAAADAEGVGRRIREVRKKAKLTQEQFGKKIGFSKNYIYYVEAGKYNPSDDFLSKVSTVFTTSYSWLVTGDGPIEATDPVDEQLIDWLRRNPEIVRELRIRSGLD